MDDLAPTPPMHSRGIVPIVVGGCAVLLIAIPIVVTDPWRWGALGAGVLGLLSAIVGAVRRRDDVVLAGALIGAVLGLCACAAVGMPTPRAIAGLGVVIALSAGFVARSRLTGSIRADVRGGRAESGRILEEIRDHVMLSDTARRVLFRQREIGLLRTAIERDIKEARYGSAMALCTEMAESFGYRQEAETFRSQIVRARQEHEESEIRAGLDLLDGLLRERQWAKAHQESARLRRLFGDSSLLHDLESRVRLARDEHGRNLESRFREAAAHEDWESAYVLLRELDRYLTREDAVRLTELAQTVLLRHQELVGTRFRLAVNERRWADAAEVGASIIAEFPGTKMADEVSGMIDRVRTRATQSALEETG